MTAPGGAIPMAAFFFPLFPVTTALGGASEKLWARGKLARQGAGGRATGAAALAIRHSRWTQGQCRTAPAASAPGRRRRRHHHRRCCHRRRGRWCCHLRCRGGVGLGGTSQARVAAEPALAEGREAQLGPEPVGGPRRTHWPNGPTGGPSERRAGGGSAAPGAPSGRRRRRAAHRSGRGVGVARVRRRRGGPPRRRCRGQSPPSSRCCATARTGGGSGVNFRVHCFHKRGGCSGAASRLPGGLGVVSGLFGFGLHGPPCRLLRPAKGKKHAHSNRPTQSAWNHRVVNRKTRGKLAGKRGRERRGGKIFCSLPTIWPHALLSRWRKPRRTCGT